MNIIQILKTTNIDDYKLAQKLFSFQEKLGTARQQLIFNLRCKRENVIPKSLRFNPPIQTTEIINYFKTTVAKRCLRSFISNNHNRINNYVRDIEQIMHYFSEKLTPSQVTELKEMGDRINRTKSSSEKERLKIKFEDLQKRTRPPINAKAVINLSSKTITETELSVLARGGKFALAPTKKDKIEFLATVESVIGDLRTTQAEKAQLRQSLVSSMNVNNNTINITREEKKALNNIKNDNTLKIVPADKGNALVLIDKSDYEQKLKDHLDSAAYVKLENNPVNRLKNKVNNTIKKN